MQQPLIAITDVIVGLQFGKSRKFIPLKLRNRLKVYKYKLRLFQRIRKSDPTINLREQIRMFRQRRRTVLFYPEIPWENSVIYKICIQNGYRISYHPQKKFDLAVKWKDSTFYQPDLVLQDLAESSWVVNVGCNDISKAHLESVSKEVFGYGSLVDPRTYRGKCVRKSTLNAKHDGVIIDCPVETIDEGSIYQILIDNRVSEDRVMDMRVPVFAGRIPFVSLWYKKPGARFQPDFEENEYIDASKVMSQEEQVKILRFCQIMGLDYGELDILRNNIDGRIHIIDVNNTPTGETREMYDLERQACAFEDAFLANGREGQNFGKESREVEEYLNYSTVVL